MHQLNPKNLYTHLIILIMAVIRFKALEQVFDRKPNHVPPPSDKTSDYYAINVFDRVKMQKVSFQGFF